MTKPKPSDASPSAPALSAGKPEIDYPCLWPYTVIGEDGDALETILPAVLAGEDAHVTRKRASRSGRYVSFDVAVEVRDEMHRDAIFRDLQAVTCVKIVL